ncbi:MAG: tail protein X [Pseudomonadota bacterium]
MSALYRTIDGDVADAICWRLFGQTRGLTEALFEANPGLADHGPVLPAGLLLRLPEAQQTALPQRLKLWD